MNLFGEPETPKKATRRSQGRLLDVEIMSTHRWKTNGELVADMERLGFFTGLDGEELTVLDATYGEGKFWTHYRPAVLFRSDAKKTTGDLRADFTALPFATSSIGVVVVDPPYKLSGTPQMDDMDYRYGVDVDKVSANATIDLIVRGAVEGFRVCSRYLIVKVQDQRCGSKKWFQTDYARDAVHAVGGVKVERFDMIGTPIPQPHDEQKTARNNTSQALVFEKPAPKTKRGKR